MVHMRYMLCLVFLLGCDGSLVDPPPPADPVYCPLTVGDIQHGIGLYECSPRVYICHGEFEVPPGGCVVYPSSPQIAGTCVVADPAQPGGCPK